MNISPARLCEVMPATREGSLTGVTLDTLLEDTLPYIKPHVRKAWHVSGAVPLVGKAILRLDGMDKSRHLVNRVKRNGYGKVRAFDGVTDEERSYYSAAWGHHAKVIGEITTRLVVAGHYLRDMNEITDIIVRDEEGEDRPPFTLNPANSLAIALETAANKIYFRAFSEGATHPSEEVFRLFRIADEAAAAQPMAE